MLNCAPVIEAMAVTDFPCHRLEAWSTGGTEEGDSTKIYSQKCNAKLQNSSKPENQMLKLKSSVLPVRMPRAFLARQSMQLQLGMGLAVDSLAPSVPQELTPLEHAPTVLCPQGDSVVAAAHRVHRNASDDLTFAVTPAECGVLSPA